MVARQYLLKIYNLVKLRQNLRLLIKEGFTFSVWYSNQSLTTIFDFTSLIVSDITLYAKWLPIIKENYTVTFDSDGGSSVVQQIIRAGECATEPDIPTKSNYLFIGWYTKKEFSFMFDFNTPITGDITLYAKWYNENNTLDTDGDGLTDELELTIGTDPYSVDIDNDGLTDFEEINLLNYDPLVVDTDGNGIFDKDEDPDGDGLKNYEEKQHGTNMMLADSDYDGLSDYDEINVYYTSPTNPDTDGDQVDDGTEVSIGSDPNKAEITFTTIAEGGTVANDITISVSMKSVSDGAGTLKVEHVTMENNPLISPMIPGFLDAAYEVTADSLSLESAIITFSLNSVIKESVLEPTVYYLNDETGLLEEVENQRTEGNKVIAEVTHFSTYILLDKVDFDSVWDKTITPPDSDEDSNGDKIPDYYAELINSGRLVLSNGSAWLEGVLDVYGRDNADWDGDGLLNGEEIRVIEKDGQYYLYMNSDPLLYDTDNDGFSDYREAKVLNTSPMKKTLPSDLDMSTSLTQVLDDVNFNDDIALKYLDFSKEEHWMQYIFDHSKRKQSRKALMEFFSTCLTAEALEKDVELDKRLSTLQTIKERITLAKKVLKLGKQTTEIATSLYPDKISDPEAENMKDLFDAIRSQRDFVALLSNILHQDINNMNILTKAIETAGGIVFVSDFYNIVSNFKLLKEGASTIDDAMESIFKVTKAVKEKSNNANAWLTAAEKLFSIAKEVCKVNDKFLHLDLPVKGKLLKSLTKNMQTSVGTRTKTVLEIDDLGNITKVKEVEDVTRGDIVGFGFSVVFDAMDTIANLIGTLDTYGKIKMNYVGFEESLETLRQISKTTSLPSYVRSAAQDLIKLFDDDDNVDWKKFNQAVIKASVGEVASGAFNIILDAVGFYFPVMGVVHGIASAVSTFGGLDERARTIVAAQTYYSITDASRTILTSLIHFVGSSKHFIEFEDEDYADVMKYIAQLAQSRVTGLETVENYIIAGKTAGWFERGSPIGILLDQKTQNSIVFGYQDAITRVYSIARQFGITLGLTSNSTVTGKIYDYSTNIPLEDVLLQIRKGLKNISGDILTKTTTDSQGQYVLNFPANVLNIEKNFTVELIKEGYNTSSFDLSVWGNLSRDCYMTRIEISSVSGVIRDSSDDIPIAGVTVTIISADGTTKGTTITNAKGEYSFNLGKNGNGDYKIELFKEGYQDKVFNVTVKGETRAQDEYLTHKDEAPIVYNDVPIDEAHFPDTKFRSEISYLDYNKNGILDKEEIASIKELDLSSEFFGHCKTLKGIEYLTALVKLDCRNNDLIELDLSSCKMLTTLICHNNKLMELDVSNNTVLTELHCGNNQLTTLNITHNPALELLYCRDNQLTTLDVTKNPKLRYLGCGDNQLTTLDVTNNPNLYYLGCGGKYTTAGDKYSANKLTVLDVTHNPELRDLTCDNNQLATLDVTKNPKLQGLHCGNNQLTSLDLSNNTALNWLSCEGNQLTVLDLSNCAKDIYVYYDIYDEDVNIIWPSKASSTSALSVSNANTNESYVVVATLSEFQATQTGEYTFDVSLDKTLSIGTTLVLLDKSDSEDLHGVFIGDNGEEIQMPVSEPLDHVIITADFEIGKTYTPVVAIKSDAQDANSGGCNIGALGAFIIMVSLGFMLRTRYIHRGR
jgi:uncharacterized repeat protein (TIGR02543 family)